MTLEDLSHTSETEEDSVDGSGDEIETSDIMSDPNQIQDLEQMRQLAITAQRELGEARLAQGARGGGQHQAQQVQQTRGVVLKLAAPSLDDVANYQIWKKKMRIVVGSDTIKLGLDTQLYFDRFYNRMNKFFILY